MSRRHSTKSRVARIPKKRPNRSPSSGELTTFSANDLQAMEFPPLEFLVEGLITEGLTLLAGKPKMGKSWMALDIAMSVAIGCEALGDRACQKGTTLYCALEDNPRRLRRRMEHVYGDQTTWPKNFHFTTQMKKLDDGGSEQLENWILDHSPSLVIIDTFVWLCCTNRVRDSSRESSVIAGMHEQTDTPDLQDQELASL